MLPSSCRTAPSCGGRRGEHVAVPRVKVLDAVIDSLLDELLDGVFGVRGAPLIRRVAAVGLRRILPERRGVRAAGCAIAGGVGDVADCGC
jgi:hypothetical protein